MAVILSLLVAASFQVSELPTTYELTFAKEQPRVVHVSADFSVRDSMLAMVPYGAEHIPDGWRTFIRNERLTSAGGTLRLERRPNRQWRIWATPGTRVRLEYDVAIEHDRQRWIPHDREAAYSREWGTFAVGRALFVYHDAKDSGVVVRVKAPAGWSAHTAWVQSAPDTWTISSLADLINSTIFVGDVRSFTVREGAIGVAYALGGPSFESSQGVLEDATKRLLSSYSAMFGGAPSGTNLFVVINPTNAELRGGGGGVFRRSISMTFDNPPSAATVTGWGHTLSHEFFHIWNASAMPPASPSEEWFVEGIADYYAVVTMTRLGFFTPNLWSAKANQWISRYERVAGQISLVQAGHQEWTEPGPTMLYNGGATAALALDLTIRRATKNRRSLDDGMRLLFERTRAPGSRVSNALFASAIRDATGYDPSAFFEAHVAGTHRIAVRELLRELGIDSPEGGGITLVEAPSNDQRERRTAYFRKP